MKYSGMILAAGFGKRMLPLTKNIPKPLININEITLLDNAINFLKQLNCKEIIINTHYKHLKILKHIENRKDKKIIKVIYEKEILDTGGAIKNIIQNIKNKDLIIVNSDIFWRKENLLDVKRLIYNYFIKKEPHLLLVNKHNSFGLNKTAGDFILYDDKIIRFVNGNPIFFYTGLQILNIEIFKNTLKNKFSINEIWDILIKENKLHGQIMNSKWYHVGDIHGLNIVKKIDP